MSINTAAMQHLPNIGFIILADPFIKHRWLFAKTPDDATHGVSHIAECSVLREAIIRSLSHHKRLILRDLGRRQRGSLSLVSMD
ncbi:unnamed protein product [Nezara viridula]|uniref:Uncharacterized protein n=1 Tax=Nezara viridula TaxID=85310 RepID=A0A9P0EIN6_NEZVI|nr:unnamed protein product [Nezara viridula]